MTLVLRSAPGRATDGALDEPGPPDEIRAVKPDSSFTFPGSSYPLSASRHLSSHLTWMLRCGRSDRSLFCRRRSVVLLAEHLGYDPADTNSADLDRWQETLLQTSVKHMQWNTALVRPYFAWMRAAGLRDDDPAALLAVPRIRRGLPRPMSETKVMRAVGQAPPRILPWLLLAGWAGLRAGEIANLRVDDFTVDASGHVFVRVVGKGDRVRDVALPGWAWEIIGPGLPPSGGAWRRQRRSRGEMGVVTPKHVSKACNSYLRSIGIPDTLHSLRHRAATLALAESGGDLALVQTFLGHEDPKTTRIYADVNPRRMAAVVEALPAPPGLTRSGRHLHAVDAREGSA